MEKEIKKLSVNEKIFYLFLIPKLYSKKFSIPVNPKFNRFSFILLPIVNNPLLLKFAFMNFAELKVIPDFFANGMKMLSAISDTYLFLRIEVVREILFLFPENSDANSNLPSLYAASNFSGIM